MGMDWHSSGITTSVMGALKKGLNPRAHELGVYICGGRGRQSRNTPQELRADRRAARSRRRRAGPHQPPDRAHRQQRDRRRLSDLPALVRPDGRRRLGDRAAGDERGEPAGAALSLAFGGACATSPPTRTPPSSASPPARSGTWSMAAPGRRRRRCSTIARDGSGNDPGQSPAPGDAGAARRARGRRQREAARRRAGARARARAA